MQKQTEEKTKSKAESRIAELVPKPNLVFSWDAPIKLEKAEPKIDDSSGEKLARADYWKKIIENKEKTEANKKRSLLEIEEGFRKLDKSEENAFAIVSQYGFAGKKGEEWAEAFKKKGVEDVCAIPLEFISKDTGLRFSCPLLYGKTGGKTETHVMIDPRTSARYEGDSFEEVMKSFIRYNKLPSGTLYAMSSSSDIRNAWKSSSEIPQISIEGKESSVGARVDAFMAFLGTASLVSLAIPEPVISKAVGVITGVPAGIWFTAHAGYELIVQNKLETLGANSETAKNAGMLLSGMFVGGGKICTVVRTGGNLIFTAGLTADAVSALENVQDKAATGELTKKQMWMEMLKLGGFVGINVTFTAIGMKSTAKKLGVGTAVKAEVAARDAAKKILETSTSTSEKIRAAGVLRNAGADKTAVEALVKAMQSSDAAVSHAAVDSLMAIEASIPRRAVERMFAKKGSERVYFKKYAEMMNARLNNVYALGYEKGAFKPIRLRHPVTRKWYVSTECPDSWGWAISKTKADFYAALRAYPEGVKKFKQGKYMVAADNIGEHLGHHIKECEHYARNYPVGSATRFEANLIVDKTILMAEPKLKGVRKWSDIVMKNAIMEQKKFRYDAKKLQPGTAK
ncbi:MAG: HEAT repeat domain-containing protein [Candidatus Micrarchaeota archaeon]